MKHYIGLVNIYDAQIMTIGCPICNNSLFKMEEIETMKKCSACGHIWESYDILCNAQLEDFSGDGILGPVEANNIEEAKTLLASTSYIANGLQTVYEYLDKDFITVLELVKS